MDEDDIRAAEEHQQEIEERHRMESEMLEYHRQLRVIYEREWIEFARDYEATERRIRELQL